MFSGHFLIDHVQSGHFLDYVQAILFCKLGSYWVEPNEVIIQPDQINMAVFFWYLVKSDLYNVSYSTWVHWTRHLYKVKETHGHV